MDTATKKELYSSKLNQLLEVLKAGSNSVDDSQKETKVVNKQNRTIISSSVYDNRLKVQKEIIESQKATISDQVKTIDKLKLQNTSLENEVAFLKGLVEELKNRPTGNEDNFTKFKDRTFMKPPKDPNILIRMKQREEERKLRWQYIKEQKANKERIEQVLLAEKKEEERLKSIEEKRRKEQEEIDRKMAAEEELKRLKARKQVVSFKLKNWENKLFTCNGFWKWTLCIKLVHAKRDMVAYRISKIFFFKYFQIWQCNSSILRENKIVLARNIYLRKLMRKVFNKWIEFTEKKRLKRETIERCFKTIIIYNLMMRWKQVACENQIRKEETKKIIFQRLQRLIISIYLTRWKEFPLKIQEKREQEQRLRTWHSRVKEILPDFDID